MSYTITITQKTEEQKEEQGAYCQIGIICLQANEYQDLSFEDRKRFELKADGTYVKPNYDYPPKRIVTKAVDTKIFEQTVDELDVAAVIVAVNGLRNVQ